MKQKNFGIYWGHSAFSIVEVEKNKTLKIANVPFDTPISSDQSQDIPEALRFTALIQKTLREKNITAKKANLSLPTEDLIFRSFVIPWMQPEEVKSVVDFEATKYIPIKLEDLSYTFHPLTFTDNGQKNIRILFVAIRKDILQRYTGIIEHSGLQVGHIEPSAVSLIRVLVKHKHISQNGSFAILEFEPAEGKIIIVEHGVVQFIRKFQIPANQNGPDIQNAQLFNDIRVSFNFYSRQNPQGTIGKIITVSANTIPDLSKNLAEEFGISATSIIAADILSNEDNNTLEILNAYGIASRDKSFSSKNFDLSDKAIKIKGGSANVFTYLRRYKVTAGVAVACTLAVLFAHLISGKMSVDSKNRLAKLKEEQGIFNSLSKDDIDELTKKINGKFNNYKKIRSSSETAFYLLQIPQALPPGVWLNDFTMEYKAKSSGRGEKNKKSNLSLTMKGLIYHPDPNEQFRIVNTLVSWFEGQQHFGDTFSNIVLANSSQTNFQNYTVISFTIKFN